MDFRDVQAFNYAMLAKQAWQLIHNTHSLFYRIYKSRYFPNCSFMNADWATTLPICGEVYWQLEISLEKVHNGRWGMAAILKCLPIASYQTSQYFKRESVELVCVGLNRRSYKAMGLGENF